MEPLVLKKSCDACTHSKVKCGGGYPCERCVQKKVQCFYSPRKRRMKPKKPKREKIPVSGEGSENNNSVNRDSLPSLLDPDDDPQQSHTNSNASVAGSSFAGSGSGSEGFVNNTKKKQQKTSSNKDIIVSQSSFDPNVPLGSLVDWERRSWSVFFTLYKHYGTSCSLHWFNRQLNKMKNYLSRQGNTESLRRLTAWMEALNIDIDGLASEVERCRIKMFIKRNQLTLHVKGSVREKGAKMVKPLLQNTNEKIPFIKLTTSYSPSFEEDDVKVEANEAFGLVFGVTEKAIREQLKWTGGGFLPWGGDILSRLLTQEKDLLAFVQILAIKFNTLGAPTELPMTRDVPSCHIFEVNIKESVNSLKLIAVNALVKCMHREIMTEDKSFLEVSMEFTPLAPHEHLLSGNRVSDETTVLDLGPEPVLPFPTAGGSDRTQYKKRKNTGIIVSEGKEFEEDEDDEFLVGSGRYNNSSNSYAGSKRDSVFSGNSSSNYNSPNFQPQQSHASPSPPLSGQDHSMSFDTGAMIADQFLLDMNDEDLYTINNNEVPNGNSNNMPQYQGSKLNPNWQQQQQHKEDTSALDSLLADTEVGIDFSIGVANGNNNNETLYPNDVLEDQTRWLDGLLDWAETQDLRTETPQTVNRPF